MSRVSQGSINDIAYLYEEINIQQNDFLNEESEYYDSETAEIVEDILSTISISMVYEGYSAEGIIGFLADSSEQDIVEKYLNFNENVLTESTVSEDYILEQLEILENRLKLAADLAKSSLKTLFGRGPGYVATRLQGPRAPGLIDKGKVLVSKAVGKVKDIAKGAKAALTGTTARRIAKGAAIVGLSGLSGYLGAKMAGAGKEQKPSTVPRPDKPSTPPKDDFLKGSALAKLGAREGRIKGGEFRTMSWSPESRARYNAASKGNAKPPVTPPAAPGGGSGTPSGGGGGRGTGTPSGGAGGAGRSTSQTRTPQPSGQTGNKEEDMRTWARTWPDLAARVEPGQAGWRPISGLRDKPSDYEKQDQTPTQGSSTAQVDPSSVQADIEAEKERLRKRAEQQRNTTTPTTTTTKESYEPYDIILEYLIGRGHADTINEANYIMMEMDQNAIGIIMQEYNDYLLAEEVSEWVDGLLEEGYDLSDYTWDDIVEYYVTEANKAERKLGMNPRQREISRNLRYKNLHVKPSKRRHDSDFYNPENLKPRPKNTYSGDESDSWHDSMSQVRRVRSKVNKNKN